MARPSRLAAARTSPWSLARSPAAERWWAARSASVRGPCRPRRAPPIAVGLLEVVAEDLLVLGHSLAGRRRFRASRRTARAGRAEPLRGRAIGGVTDEDVLEPVGDADRRRGLAAASRIRSLRASWPARRVRTAARVPRRARRSPPGKISPSTAPRSSASRSCVSSRSRRARGVSSSGPLQLPASPQPRHELLGVERVAAVRRSARGRLQAPS